LRIRPLPTILNLTTAPRLCELSGTAGTGKSIGALVLIDGISSGDWADQPVILYVHRRSDHVTRDLKTRGYDGQMHLLARDGKTTRHFRSERGVTDVCALLWHQLDERRKLIMIVDSVPPALILEYISPCKKAHLCLHRLVRDPAAGRKIFALESVHLALRRHLVFRDVCTKE
jgi:hypothetical protein